MVSGVRTLEVAQEGGRKVTDTTTNNLTEFFDVLINNSTAYWGFPFMWQEISDSLRVPIYVFYQA